MEHDFFEYDEGITHKLICFGSLMGIVQNKDISVVAYVNILLGDAILRENFCLYMDMTFSEVVREFGKRYGILEKSKKLSKLT